MGVLTGGALTLGFLRLEKKTTKDSNDDSYGNPAKKKNDPSSESSFSSHDCSSKTAKRQRLPELVLLVRHGESEGNVDKTTWWRKPDHKIALTPRGKEQALEAGRRIESIFRAYETSGATKIRNVHLHVSPFDRTMETARIAYSQFRRRIRAYKLFARLREQEFGNSQNHDDFYRFREEQKQMGRFWYRFPTGESGADVLDRVESWWLNDLLETNEHVPHAGQLVEDEEGEWEDDNGNDEATSSGRHHCNAVVVFTHGLTMRLILCQLFHWSVDTFHSVYNAHNCSIYVLRRDLSQKGRSPYALDRTLGNFPTSSVNIQVKVKTRRSTPLQEESSSHNEKDGTTTTRTYKLMDYLSLPSPRRHQTEEIKTKLVEQYPEDFQGGPNTIESITFLPYSRCSDLCKQDPCNHI